jgi:hypothetical protein
MLPSLKRILWMTLLASGLQTSWAFSLLGPVANGAAVNSGFADTWQVEAIGYNPIPSSIGAPPGFIDSLLAGPKNLGEEYRRNTPVIYYTCDANFLDYFGSSGLDAVDQAFAILNDVAMTNISSYSQNLSEFSLNTTVINYQAQALSLLDVKSETLALMTEQLGLADPVRYAWALHNRFQPTGTTCPDQTTYQVIMRNYDFMNSPPNQLQYSPYINGSLFTYYIAEICNSPAAPPNAVTVPFFVDLPPMNNPPVASLNQDGLQIGSFFTGLTRDDVAGLRYLINSNNVLFESMVPGSTPVAGSGSTITNLNDEFTLVTSSLAAFLSAALTNNPGTLQSLYPGLVITKAVTNFNGTFTYTFGNVVTNHFSTNTTVQLQVKKTTIAPVIGAPAGSPDVTNTTTTTTTVVSNTVSGDFFLIPTNLCGLNILQTLATNRVTLTNSSASVTNVSGSKTTITQTNVVTSSTNYTLLVAPCEFLSGSVGTNSTTGLFQGVEKITFVRADFDSLLGQFFQPITNQYNVMLISNSKLVPVTLQRVVTTPDILFSAADLLPGPAAINTGEPRFARSINFDQSHIGLGLAGPGVIDPSSLIVYNKVGPVLLNTGTAFLDQSSATVDVFVWGSFDETTNDPIVYPNGASIADLENQVLVQISPSSLPNGTNGVAYPPVTFTVTGGAFTPPYTWSAPSGLPPGLGISNGGTISGTPTQPGTFDFIIQLTDSLSRQATWGYSITIN